MARRRSRKLSGSPEDHTREARKAYTHAKKLGKEVVRLSRDGKCVGALEKYGHLMESVAVMSSRWLPERVSLDLMNHADSFILPDAQGSFVDRCLVGGKVSGLGASPLPKAEGIDKRGRKVKLVVKKDRSWGEWAVKTYVNGKFSEAETYHTADKQDVIDSFRAMKASYGLAGMRKRRR